LPIYTRPPASYGSDRDAPLYCGSKAKTLTPHPQEFANQNDSHRMLHVRLRRICRRDGFTAMSPSEFRTALAALDLSQVEAARLFGRTPRCVQRWIAGDRAIPPEAVILVRLMLAGKITPDDISP
jgi:hypothetical protein